jgi:hypothetical protein
MKVSFAVVVLLLCVGAKAQTVPPASPAPVTILKATPHQGTHVDCAAGGECFNNGVNMGIEYRNDSNKEITAVKFTVTFLDAVNDKHEMPYSYTSDKKLKPGKTYTATWQNLTNTRAKRMEAKVTKVLFADGTTWEEPKAWEEPKR